MSLSVPSFTCGGKTPIVGLKRFQVEKEDGPLFPPRAIYPWRLSGDIYRRRPDKIF